MIFKKFFTQISRNSKLPEYQIYGENRTNLLMSLEDFLNTYHSTLDLRNLSTLCSVGAKLNLNSADYWKTIAKLTENNLMKCNHTHADSISNIYRALISKSKYVDDAYIDILERKLIGYGDHLSIRSAYSILYGLMTKNSTSDFTLKPVELICQERMEKFDEKYMNLIGGCMHKYELFGQGEGFKESLEKVCMNRVDSFKVGTLANLIKGISSKGWVFKEFLELSNQKCINNIKSLNYLELHTMAWAMIDYGEGQERVYSEEMSKRRQKNQSYPKANTPFQFNLIDSE
jgi:hypothetical protein